jgi:hypothetical protein
MLRPGDGFAAFDAPGEVFPEAAREWPLDGAEAVTSMAAWPMCRLRPARWTRAIARCITSTHSTWPGRWKTRSFGYPLITMARSVVCVSPDPARSSIRMAVCLRRAARGPGALSQAWIPEQWSVVCAKSLFHLGDRVAGAYGVIRAAYLS